MTKDQIWAQLIAAVRGVRGKLPRTEWYGFGSFFNADGPFRDIDVLAVCADEKEVLRARSVLEGLTSDLPIHLVVMTCAEAIETEFIARQRCRALLEPPRSSS